MRADCVSGKSQGSTLFHILYVFQALFYSALIISKSTQERRFYFTLLGHFSVYVLQIGVRSFPDNAAVIVLRHQFDIVEKANDDSAF